MKKDKDKEVVALIGVNKNAEPVSFYPVVDSVSAAAAAARKVRKPSPQYSPNTIELAKRLREKALKHIEEMQNSRNKL